MPARTIVGQFSKSEFFSVLPPGFYTFIVVFSCYAVSAPQGARPSTLWMIFDALSAKIYSNPVLLIFVLFACYLFGSIFRTLPVYWAEMTVRFRNPNFPYSNVLSDALVELGSHAKATKHDSKKLPDLTQGVPMNVFNYWKNLLCLQSPEGFEYYQTFETRVRFFGGMIWSAWFGILGSIYIFIVAVRSSWPIGAAILTISLVVLASFGLNFRRVRTQEAKALLLIFTAHMQR